MAKHLDLDNLTFNKFRQLALDHTLSINEKVGFPDEYREGREGDIFSDICAKLPTLQKNGVLALDIGPGCSQLPLFLANACAKANGKVYFIDSAEMLNHLPDGAHIHKAAGRFPEVPDLLRDLAGKVDAILCYSVLQYIFSEGNIWDFFDRSLMLLKEGGQMLIGDIPNMTMRKRLFCSNEGLRLHKSFTGRDEPPLVRFNTLETGRIDDSIVLAILARVRAQGFHGWVLPQNPKLPMANRREDILIQRP